MLKCWQFVCYFQVFINEVDNDPASQAVEIVLNYIKKNPSLGLSVQLMPIEGNRTDSKKFLESSKCPLTNHLNQYFNKLCVFKATYIFQVQFLIETYYCGSCTCMNFILIQFKFCFAQIRSLFSVYGGCKEQSTSAHCIWYDDNECCLGNSEIINFCLGIANGERVIWPRGWHSAMAWYKWPKASIFIASDATIRYHTWSHTIDNRLHEHYQCGYPLRWIIWWAKSFCLGKHWKLSLIFHRIIYAVCLHTEH